MEAEHKRKKRRIVNEKAAKKRKKIIAITVPIVCACIAFIIVLIAVIIPKQKYNNALKLIEFGNYEAAYMLLKDLEYKDSGKKINEILAEYPDYKFKHADVGDIITFGTYEQDNNTFNGKEDIEWLVLAKEDNRILVISDKALDCQRYNPLDDVTWETCELRKWLNSTFLNEAFSTEEQAQIQSATVSADENPKYSTNPGNATTDKVFLLSIAEAKKYFSSSKDRKCIPTEYALAQGAYTSFFHKKDGEDTCWWWLRTPGDCSAHTANVYYSGSTVYKGSNAYYSDGCVRPALWINLDS